MDLITLVTFAVAYAIAVAIPGPGVAAIVARALGGGFREAFPMVVGILAGDMVYLLFALFGLAAVATWFSPIFVVVKWASAIYLLYIAWQFWTAKPGGEKLAPKKGGGAWRAFVGGFALTLGNPKTIAFYLALLPTVLPLDRPITLIGLAELTVITATLLLAIGSAYAALAASARDLFRTPKSLKLLNRTAASIMAGAAAFVMARG
ncbi:LysE family translocator [Devosia sp.]|uniref:LysE family translocator n=1 Tax=Devosia sp. TaxID=1871048 RepID=UPI003A8D8465